MRPSKSVCAIAEPVLTLDSSRTVKSARYGESYHSSFGALTESRHVFLERSGVLDRLERGQDTRVLEIGFGLGLNCLLSADAALTHGVNLEYHAFEHDLLERQTIAAMDYQTHLRQPELVDRLLAGVFDGLPESGLRASADGGDAARKADGPHRRVNLAGASDTRIELYLSLQDATNSPWPQCTRYKSFDAIYLDAFSPDTNAECWTEEMLTQLHAVLRPDGGTLATYCAKGAVRRRLDAVGFIVNRHAGPPGKREILSASRMD